MLRLHVLMAVAAIAGGLPAAFSHGGDWLAGEYHGRISGCSHCGGSLYGAWRGFDGGCFEGGCNEPAPWGEGEAPCCGGQAIPAPTPSPAHNGSAHAVPYWESRRAMPPRPIYRLALPPTYGPYWTPSPSRR